MLFKATILAVFSLLAAQGAMAIPTTAPGEVGIMIATDPYYACNCPKNCSHKEGSSCKYYSGPSDTSGVTKGKCYHPNGNTASKLQCIA